MTITLTINNEHYINGLTELSRIAKLCPNDLCGELLCGAVDRFYRERRTWEEKHILEIIPERAARQIEKMKTMQEATQ